MVREMVPVTKCDVDGSRDARTWRIVDPDGNAVELDLCDVHARPLRKIFDQGHAPEPEVPAEKARKQAQPARSRVEVIDPKKKAPRKS